MLPRMITGDPAAIDLAELAGVASIMDSSAESTFGHRGAC